MTFTGLIGRIFWFPLRLIINTCVALRIHPNVLTFMGVLINIAAAITTLGGIYLDVRNLLDRKNVVAVRRDTGEPHADESAIQLMAEEAYAADPSPIPFESGRYRAEADIDGDGFIAGRDELFPMYLQAANDYAQPIFAYGTPRLARLGVELLF